MLNFLQYLANYTHTKTHTKKNTKKNVQIHLQKFVCICHNKTLHLIRNMHLAKVIYIF